ncbi:MAG TPA: hypothetical protein VFM71_06535 [Gemmatimonadaceae bacterium]|nr:hypothetical protein [Gemmatimonadaceae bacterium]
MPLPRCRLLPFVVALAPIVVTPLGAFAELGAQVTLVDEGTFSLYVSGERVGREDFSIRAAPGPGGSAYVAQGNVTIGDDRITVALNADSAGRPLRFQLEALVRDRTVETISGESRRGLWMGRALRERGESAREFRLPADAIAAVDGVIHHLWFVVRRGAGSTPVLLLPRSLSLREVALEDAGADSVSLGLRTFAAHRWVIRPTDDLASAVEVWTDPLGRLLQVRIPSRDLEARRDEPPAESSTAR